MLDMINEKRKAMTQSQIDKYAEEVFELYSSSVGELNVQSEEESFVKKLVSNCVNIFSEAEIFDILKLLRKKGLMKEDILRVSQVQKVNRDSNIIMRESVKEEIEEFTYNSAINHIRNGNIMFSYETKCYTLPSLENKIIIGDNFANLIYKDNGKSIEQEVIKSSKSRIDFNINNIIILHKRNLTEKNVKEFINVIIVPRLELESYEHKFVS